jgi:hypothetical protein
LRFSISFAGIFLASVIIDKNPMNTKGKNKIHWKDRLQYTPGLGAEEGSAQIGHSIRR